MMAATNKLLTVAQAAERLGVTPIRVRQFCQEGRIGEKLGDRWIITEEELEAFQRQRTGRPKKI